MLLRMLVPLDGSPLAERALEVATVLAQRLALTRPAREPLVILCRAVDPSPWLDLAGEDARTQALEAAAHYLQERAAGLRNEGLTVETAVRLGQPAAELLEQVLARKVDLVIISTHGHSGLARWVLGSVAERVARSAPVPVLLLPTAAPATLTVRDAQGAAMMPRLLVPLDRSARAEAALPPALELARLLQAELRLLSVVVPKLEEGGAEEKERTAGACHALAGAEAAEAAGVERSSPDAPSARVSRVTPASTPGTCARGYRKLSHWVTVSAPTNLPSCQAFTLWLAPTCPWRTKRRARTIPRRTTGALDRAAQAARREMLLHARREYCPVRGDSDRGERSLLCQQLLADGLGSPRCFLDAGCLSPATSWGAGMRQGLATTVTVRSALVV